MKLQLSPAPGSRRTIHRVKLATRVLNREGAKARRNLLFSPITPLASLAPLRFNSRVAKGRFGSCGFDHGDKLEAYPTEVSG